jgi:transposase
MAYRYGDRYQIELLPQSIEDYVSLEDPVRAYDAFVESLDLKALGIVWEECKVGNCAYEPGAMIKLLTYGYSYGFRSSRKLERATYHNISFIWLMGGLKPDHKTISNFRKDNEKALKNILKQCARLCIKLELIEGNTLFVDGSKFRANASIGKTRTKEKYEEYLKNVDNRIESILRECKNADEKEQDNPSLVKLKDELKSKEAIKKKVQELLKEIDVEKRASINSTDPDCSKVQGRQGTHAGYNAQIVVDEKHGLIVSADVVSDNNDRNQFAQQIGQANETLGRKCDNASADAGYADTEELKKIDDQGINVIVPSQEQISGKRLEPFAKEQFTYDAEKDSYRCPQGHELLYSHLNKDGQTYFRVYKISNKSICHCCKHFGSCTKAKSGRQINRLLNEETRRKLEANYRAEASQAIYKLRKQRVELPFGHMKRNLGFGAFLLRRRAGVKAEFSLIASCFNMARMITILGVQPLIAKLVV